MEADSSFSSADEVLGRGSFVDCVPPITSASTGTQMAWADVSPILDGACNDLQEGELVHGENFNLFASMSALEIMDPKMDPGVICRYYSVDDAIENGAAPVPFCDDKTNDMHNTIDLMDHLLSCEATWHKGHSLAQTVFSCIYLMKPDRIAAHTLLHTYCTVVRATCSFLLSIVADTWTNEEDDFFTITYGLPLKIDGDEQCLSILNATEETINHQLRVCNAQSNKKELTEDVEPLQNNMDMEEGYLKSLLCRLRFRKHFFHVLTCMRIHREKGLELASEHIASCISELQCMMKSSKFLQSSAQRIFVDKIAIKTTASGCKPVGFDATLNCRLTAPMPPRAVEIFCWKKAIEYFQKLLHDLDVVCSYSMSTRLEDVLRFVVRFQKLQPDLIARAHLQLLLIQDGKLYGRDRIFSVILKASRLDQSALAQNLQKFDFVIQLEQLVINLLRILCANSAWQRRKLGKVVQDWRVISLQVQMAFQKAPTSYHYEYLNASKCLLIWIEEQTYWIASRFIFLGFELELYSPCEYCMVYWYSYIVLVKLWDVMLQKTTLSINSENASPGKQKEKIKRRSRKDALKDNTKKNKVALKDYQTSTAGLLLQCHMYLAEGLFLMLAALRNEGGLLQTRNIFNTEQEIFYQHFHLLQRAQVLESVTYHSYMEAARHARFSSLLNCNRFKDAQRIAMDLRCSLSSDPESLAEAEQLELVAKHNDIALNLISRITTRVRTLDPSLKITFEFTYHPYLAVAVLKRS